MRVNKCKSLRSMKYVNKGKRHTRKGRSHIKHKRGNSAKCFKNDRLHDRPEYESDKKRDEDEQSDSSVSEVACHPLESLLSTFSGYEGIINNEASDFSNKCDPANGNSSSMRLSEVSSIDNFTCIVNCNEMKSDGNVVCEKAPEKLEDDCHVTGMDCSNPHGAVKQDAHYLDVMKLENEVNNVLDPFHKHFDYDLDTSLLQAISCTSVKVRNYSIYWPNLNNLTVEIPIAENVSLDTKTELQDQKKYAEPGEVPNLIHKLDWDELFIKSQIQNNIRCANRNQLNDCMTEDLTSLQKEIFSIINNYQDLFYPDRNLMNGEQVRFIYCLHAVNHILKTRIRILHHNERLLKKENQIVPDEFRDQGLVRPKVVMLVPFKESCLRIVNMISSILIKEDKGNIINKTRFLEEFDNAELIMPKKNTKPEDYEELFKGNIDDNFKIGLSITKKSLKIFTDFYSSDIIIASPLGLRTVIGAQGDKNRDFDFLASVELLILDQAELFLMQNWDHILLVFDHLHMQPKESHGTDFSRIRSWVLNGWSKFYRQTLIFSSLIAPEFNALFNRQCFNYAGKVRVLNPINCGSISSVIVPLSHVFQKFKADSAANANDARFRFFIEKVLPQYKDPHMAGILIYVPSYFDFVRVRNYLKREEYSFVQICEYSKDAKIARARDKFFHNETRFLLYSERFHFFRRIKLKGVRHIIFYSLPTFPHFYPELCNLMKEDNQNRLLTKNHIASVIVLYCKYDMHQLSAIVKTSRTAMLLSSEKDVHMFTTG